MGIVQEVEIWTSNQMHKPKSFLENETYKIFLDFEIQTDHLIPARQPDQVKDKTKQKLLNSGLCCLGGPQSENQRKWKIDNS